MQLNKSGFVHRCDLTILKRQFLQEHAIRLPHLLHPDLIRLVLEHMEQGAWVPYEHVGIGRELLLDSPGALGILRFVFNTPEFIKAVELITQCGQVSRFDGRVYRMFPRTDHCDSWHDDIDGSTRLVGMSLTLGLKAYRGGVFQLRKKGEKAILRELPNTRLGDAILFRISPELTHRVTPMDGTEPKTAFAGWFKSNTTDFFSDLRSLTRRKNSGPLFRK